MVGCVSGCGLDVNVGVHAHGRQAKICTCVMGRQWSWWWCVTA